MGATVRLDIMFSSLQNRRLTRKELAEVDSVLNIRQPCAALSVHFMVPVRLSVLINVVI